MKKPPRLRECSTEIEGSDDFTDMEMQASMEGTDGEHSANVDT